MAGKIDTLRLIADPQSLVPFGVFTINWGLSFPLGMMMLLLENGEVRVKAMVFCRERGYFTSATVTDGLRIKSERRCIYGNSETDILNKFGRCLMSLCCVIALENNLYGRLQRFIVKTLSSLCIKANSAISLRHRENVADLNISAIGYGTTDNIINS